MPRISKVWAELGADTPEVHRQKLAEASRGAIERANVEIIPPGTIRKRERIPQELKDALEPAVKFLVEVAVGTGKDPKMSRAEACVEVINRVLGKPAQAVNVTTDTNPVIAALLEDMRREREQKTIDQESPTHDVTHAADDLAKD